MIYKHIDSCEHFANRKVPGASPVLRQGGPGSFRLATCELLGAAQHDDRAECVGLADRGARFALVVRTAEDVPRQGLLLEAAERHARLNTRGIHAGCGQYVLDRVRLGAVLDQETLLLGDQVGESPVLDAEGQGVRDVVAQLGDLLVADHQVDDDFRLVGHRPALEGVLEARRGDDDLRGSPDVRQLACGGRRTAHQTAFRGCVYVSAHRLGCLVEGHLGDRDRCDGVDSCADAHEDGKHESPSQDGSCV